MLTNVAVTCEAVLKKIVQVLSGKEIFPKKILGKFFLA